MTGFQVIGFAEGDNEITKSLAEYGCVATRVDNTSDLHADQPIFVWAENLGWLELLRGIRALYPHTPLVVVTRIPNSSKWLEALEAGANDYCALPLQSQEVQWLIRSF